MNYELNQRHFLTWDVPFLHNVADFIIGAQEKYSTLHGVAQPNWLDLQNYIIIFPNSSAKRRFLELLLQKTKNASLIPPTIFTIGGFVDYAISKTQTNLKTFTDLEINLLWGEAIRNVYKNASTAVKEELKKVNLALDFDAQLEKEQSQLAIYSFAKKLNLIYSTLAGGLKTFPDVARIIGEMSPDLESECQRWNMLSLFYNEYCKLLQENVATDRNQKVIKFLESQTNAELFVKKNIIIAGTIDLGENQKQVLQHIKKQFVTEESKTNTTLTTLVFATDNYADYYDDYGSINIKKWLEEKIDVADEQLAICENYDGQIAASFNYLAKKQSQINYSEEITIGLTDGNIRPQLEISLDAQNIASHSGAGTSITKTKPIALLLLIQSYIINADYKNFIALLRHPDFERCIEQYLQKKEEITLSKDISVITQVIEYQTVHLQRDYGNIALAKSKKNDAIIIAIQECLQELFKNWQTKEFKTLNIWVKDFADLINEIYGARRNNTDKIDELVFAKIDEILTEIINLDIKEKFNAVDAFYLILSTISENKIYPDVKYSGVNLPNWLEIPFDDAKVLVIMGFNEGCVPETINEDAFLPNGIKDKLNIIDNNRRLARDIATFKSILESRKQDVLLTCSRIISSGRALPSRLLFIGDEERNASRVLKYFDSNKNNFAKQEEERQKIGSQPIKPITQELKYLSITALSRFIEDPYLFYLEKVLGITSFAEPEEKISDLEFGNIVHETLAELQYFKETTPNWDKLNEEKLTREIYSFLLKRLRLLYDKQFGENSFPITQYQKEVIEGRLIKFSKWQARQFLAGWEIVAIEFPVESTPIDDRTIDEFSILDLQFFCKSEKDDNFVGTKLRGRVDRIDYNAERKEFRIIDYKSGENARDIEKDYKKSKITDTPPIQFKDLQLETYAFVLRQIILREMQKTNEISKTTFVKCIGKEIDNVIISIGYINISADASDKDNIFSQLDNFHSLHLNNPTLILAELGTEATIDKYAWQQLETIIKLIIISNKNAEWEFLQKANSDLLECYGLESMYRIFDEELGGVDDE